MKKTRNPKENNLREHLKKDDKYRLLFEHVHDGIYQSTVEGKILTANPALVKMLGYDSEEELKRINIATEIYVNASERDRYLQLLREKGNLDDAELVLKKKDGSHIIVQEHSHIVYNNRGEILYYEGTLTDITQKKLAERALRESEKKYQTLIETSQDGISLFDLTGKLLYFNQRKKLMMGYESDEEFMKINTLDMIHPDDRESGKNLFREVMMAGSISNKELRIIRKDGSSFWAEFNAETLKEADGSHHLIMDTMRDITERKRNAEDMRLRLEQLRQIIDLVPSYFFAKDIDGKFLMVNKALAEVFGLEPEEIIGKTDRDYGATEEQAEGYRNADLTVIERGVPVIIPEEQVLRKDGTLGWFQTVKIPYKHPGWDRPAILGVATEITERKEIEDELRRSEERFRKLFESHAAVKLLIDPESGSIIDANNAAAEFYGWNMERLRKMNLFDICTQSPGDLKKMLGRTNQDKGIFFESVHRLASGSLRDVEVFASRIDIEDHTYLHTIVHDITDKKKILTDLIIAKEKSEESDRLKTAFMHNISHEIRTPMNAIVGFTSLMESSDLSEETRKQYFDIIYQSSNQLLSIISDIVDISNIETGHLKISPEKVNINLILRKLYEQYSYKAKLENITFVVSVTLEDSSAITICDEIKLIQVISNLLNNAFKFTTKGSVEFGYSKLNGYLQFFVKDTGSGISEENFSRIFDRFYQIENPFIKPGGTGLGLSICKAYVELMGGRIWLESEPGKGSTFYFTLPFLNIHGTQKEKKKDTEDGCFVIAPGRLILIAEDDDINYFLLNEMASAQGMRIVRAKNGLEAVERCEKMMDIDLVLMDIKMPVMDGFVATSKIKSNRPDLPVIAITAYAQDTERNKVFSYGFSDYISKPIEKKQIEKIWRNYLGSPK
jgi:PAS domain S-box-containing protein